MNRRQVLKSAVTLAATSALAPMELFAEASAPESALRLSGASERWQATYNAALAVLADNIKLAPGYDKPLLFEGAVYHGIWLECGPHEGYVYRHINPEAARQNHLAFFALQRPNGQLPASVKMTDNGYSQLQMVVPIAATAWETAYESGDSELLHKAYDACTRWDDWLVRYRNTRHTGLVEGFCTFDTGHDNSPRWSGIPERCPNGDATRFIPAPGMPRLCPDLSASVYGGRVALAEMAKALGKSSEAEHWHEKSAAIQKLINDKLYSSEDASFYDLDTDNKFVHIRGDVMTRVACEHIVSQAVFDDMWTKQFGNPKAFWAAYPLPSIAMDDPAFVRPIPRNSWGGATQALTALRAPRWMEFYGRTAELAHMMEKWVEAMSRNIEFRQQMNPDTGEFTQVDPGGYSPAALVMVDYTWRMGGPRAEGDTLEWNVRPSSFASKTCFSRKLSAFNSAEILYSTNSAQLKLNNRLIAKVTGNARVLTDRSGVLQAAIGTSLKPQTVILETASGNKKTFRLQPNEHLPLKL